MAFGMCPSAYTLAPHSGRARSERQSRTAQSVSSVWAASSEASIRVMYMLIIYARLPAGRLADFCRVPLSIQSHENFKRDNDGDRRLLGKRQSLLLAGAPRARIQAAALYEPRPAIFQAGAQIAADARAQLARQSPGAQGR